MNNSTITITTNDYEERAFDMIFTGSNRNAFDLKAKTPFFIGPLLYHKFENMGIVCCGNLYSLYRP